MTRGLRLLRIILMKMFHPLIATHQRSMGLSKKHGAKVQHFIYNRVLECQKPVSFWQNPIKLHLTNSYRTFAFVNLLLLSRMIASTI